MPLSFPEAAAKVASLQNRGWRLGLDRMEEFVRRLPVGHWPKFIHIAGTNGKGSVTAYVQSILLEQGWSTGAFFSPYVYTIRERIQFSDPKQGKLGAGSSLISPEDFAAAVEELWPISESMEGTELGGLTEFEFKTGMAFVYWSQRNCEYVALEVGLGGKLDATNVVDPVCSVITSIGLDHTEFLGNTIAEIAVQKAGIIKPGRPVVVGDVQESAWSAIESIATSMEAPVWRFGRDFVISTGFDGFRVSTPAGTYERLSPGMQGVVQPHNMAVAIAAADAAGAIKDPRRVGHGVAKAFAPARMQWATFRGQRFLLDGAHNADAAKVLVESLLGRPEGAGKIVLLTGMLEGHKTGDLYEPLARITDEAHFVPIDFHRARKPEELLSEAGWLFERSYAHKSVQEGVQACLAAGADTVLVTGSFYLAGEVGRFIGLAG